MDEKKITLRQFYATLAVLAFIIGFSVLAVGIVPSTGSSIRWGAGIMYISWFVLLLLWPGASKK